MAHLLRNSSGIYLNVQGTTKTCGVFSWKVLSWFRLVLLFRTEPKLKRNLCQHNQKLAFVFEKHNKFSKKQTQKTIINSSKLTKNQIDKKQIHVNNNKQH